MIIKMMMTDIDSEDQDDSMIQIQILIKINNIKNQKVLH